MTGQSSKLRVGVIGAGLQGQSHLACYAVMPQVEIAAIADIDADKARAAAQKYAVPRWYESYEKMLDDAPLDAVSVVTPDDLHREPCLAAAAYGKHILVEKPLATTVADGEAIVAAARKAGVKLMTHFSNRWQLPMIVAKDAIAKGEMGEPVYAYARLSNALSVPTEMLRGWSARTRLPFWLMSHTVDRVRWLFGREARRVHAISRSGVLTSLGFDTPDAYVATVEFEGGAMACFESCWILPNSLPTIVDNRMELIFTGGLLEFDAGDMCVHHATPAKYRRAGILWTEALGEPRGFVLEAMKHFVERVLAGQDPGPSGDDGLAVLRITAAIVQSAQERRIVELS
jgi:predicted dehydrogenase